MKWGPRCTYLAYKVAAGPGPLTIARGSRYQWRAGTPIAGTQFSPADDVPPSTAEIAGPAWPQRIPPARSAPPVSSREAAAVSSTRVNTASAAIAVSRSAAIEATDALEAPLSEA
ncbi:hypothetical protein NDU88_004373 [Pleurodeles waltl]|uniref:Uncharacterized protein n=1 Tax=Pleurodeles waltl TaxID=8319 RepID=A0AAV7UIX2_PLEWA|nr:hypothetical protein NDU88_004373 [Pleurodeles waltl]